MRSIILISACLLTALTAFAHGISDADKQGILEGGNLEYIKLGMTHMLTGYDHLLFLFGVMFFLTRLRDVVKFITAFTLGHCLTLVFATLLHIQANYYLVDAVIALTVCYKAFDNLDGFKKYIGVQAPNLLAAVFLFGLIHGFGLSTRLQTLPLGQEGLVLRILSFNLGVELGQIMALSCPFAGPGSYTDFSLTLAKDFDGLVVSGAIVGTDADKSFYSSPINGKELGKTTLVVGVKYNF